MRGMWSMDTIGPISRTVEDAAITLGAIAGYDPKDPYTWDTPVPDYKQALDGDIKGIRAGLVTEMIDTEAVQDEVRDAVTTGASVLSQLGASVEEVSLPLSKYSTILTPVILVVEAASTHVGWIKERLQDYCHTNRIMLLTGSVMPAQVYYKAQKLRNLLRQQVLDALERYDVLVFPTLGNPAQRIEDWEKQPRSFRLTPMFSQASAPAMTIPCGFSSGGLPIGLQIGGRPGHDATVLKVAHAYEQNTQWHTMRPPTV